MGAFDKEVMWAVSGTGEDFQCVHLDFAKEQQAEIERLRAENTNLRASMDSIRAIVLAARELERKPTDQ